MKQLIFFVLGLTLISCSTKTTTEFPKSGGIWHLSDGIFNSDGTSKKAVIGEDSDLKIAMDFFYAYEQLEPEKMVSLSEDVIKFHPGDLAGVFDVDASNTDFIDERQSTFESIERTVVNVTPLAVEGSKNYTVVEINFTEVITHKDGSSTSAHYFERIHVENKKVNRVVQWMRPM